MSKKPSLSDASSNGSAEKSYEYILRLFITGSTSNSVRAVNNLKQLCEEHLKGRYFLEIIDVYQQAGIAEMIPESDEGNETPKRLALHAKIAVGTNVYVTNDTNGQRVLVRIIGKLSQNDINNNVIIKLSPAACKELSANTKQFRVTLMYNH